MAKSKKLIHDQYSWHFLAREVAEYTHCNFFEIMEKAALEVAGIVVLIQMKTELNRK